MTSEFQGALLNYLFQDKTAKIFITYLDDTLWDSVTQQIVFKLLKDYIKQYKHIPSKPNFIEFFEREWQDTKSAQATPAVKTAILNDIAKVYIPLSSDTIFIREMIVDFAQKKLTTRLFTKNADKIVNGSDKFFKNLEREMAKIVKLRELDTAKDTKRGPYYIAEADKPRITIKPLVKYSPWNALNRMTNAGGFFAPQLIVFMKGPKVFGTGLFLQMVAFDLKQGEKVFYADTENGIDDILLRLDMALLECEESEVKNKQKELKWIKRQIALRGGEFKPVYFDGGKATIEDLDYELTDAYEKTGFVPTKLYNDYIDKFVPSDKSIKEVRLKIRDVYLSQVELNVKWNVPCFTISPVTSDSIGQAYYTTKDYGEAKDKAYNAHATFGICCTEKEYRNGTLRIIPVSQRKGLAFQHNALTTCTLKVDMAKSKVEELNSEAYLALMDLDADEKDTKKSKTIRPIRDIKDE